MKTTYQLVSAFVRTQQEGVAEVISYKITDGSLIVSYDDTDGGHQRHHYSLVEYMTFLFNLHE
jgi:hypothetical protein